MSIHCQLVLVCDVYLTCSPDDFAGPDWNVGPYVETYTDHVGREVRTDAATRATNFPASLAGRLLGQSADSSQQVRFTTDDVNTRWDNHQPWNADVPAVLPAPTLLRRAELLVSAPGVHDHEGSRPGILALRFEITAATFADAVGVADSLARQRGRQGESQLHGALTYKMLRTLHTSISSRLSFPTDAPAGSDTESSIYSMLMIDQAAASVEPDKLELDIKQAYSAASCQNPDKLHASEDALDRALNAAVPLSKSWTALFLRHGASFIVHTANDDPYRRFMPIYFGTLYADAVMLVRLQMLLVRQVEGATEALLERAATDPHLGSVSRDFEHLDRQLAINSARYWMRRSESNAGNSVKIIHAIQDAMAFTDRLAALDAQIDGLARLSEADAQKRSLEASNKLGKVVTLMGSVAIPVTIATDTFQLLGLAVTVPNISGLAVCIAVTGGLTWFGLNRLLPRP